MRDVRFVALDVEQAMLLEEVGVDLLREGDEERATQLLAMHLAWRFADPKRKAEVVELNGYSKKVPCK